MEAYTNITIKMENNEVVKKATERIIGVIRKSELYKSEAKNFEIFINDIKTKGNEIVIEESYALNSGGFKTVPFLMAKSIATLDEVKAFTVEANYYSCNCGYEAYFDAEYKNEMLRTEELEGEELYGWCEECGTEVVFCKDYDSSIEYICEECGERLTEEMLFPNGVPQPTVSWVEIW